MNDLTALFSVNIEEAVASIFLGLALFSIRPGWKKVVLMGLLQGFIVYVIRFTYAKLSIPLGTHMFFSLASYMIIIRFMGRTKWGIAIAAGLVSFVSVALSELLMWPLIFRYTNLTYEQIISNPVSHIFATYVGDSLMYLLAIIVGLTGFSLIRTRD